MFVGIILGIVGTLLVKRYAPSLLLWVDKRVDELIDAAPTVVISHDHIVGDKKGRIDDDSDD